MREKIQRSLKKLKEGFTPKHELFIRYQTCSNFFSVSVKWFFLSSLLWAISSSALIVHKSLTTVDKFFQNKFLRDEIYLNASLWATRWLKTLTLHLSLRNALKQSTSRLHRLIFWWMQHIPSFILTWTYTHNHPI